MGRKLGRVTYEAHLLLKRVQINPGEEWSFPGEGWRVLSIDSGEGYCLQPEVRNIVPGDALVISPIGQAVLRASQLGALEISAFRFQPERLTGLLTPGERQFLEQEATQQRLAYQYLPASSVLAKRLASVIVESRAGFSLAHRSAILQWISTAVGMDALVPLQPASKASRSRERFLQLVGQMTENDLMSCTVEALARKCGCSTRHLNRLFQESFHISLSARQTELRMLRAAHLLRETHLRISQVAQECGYRHIGLFNATFKRRWNQTPTQWRRGNVEVETAS